MTKQEASLSTRKNPHANPAEMELADIQKTFLDALWQTSMPDLFKTPQANTVNSTISTTSANAALNRRLKIHRTTVGHGLYTVLKQLYPGTWLLLRTSLTAIPSADTLTAQEQPTGPTITVDHIARGFLSCPSNAPSTGCLDDWGNTFPTFLHQRLPSYFVAENWPDDLSKVISGMLSDYALFEWTKHNVYQAADAPVTTTDSWGLEKPHPGHYQDCFAKLIPGAQVISSSYPLQKLTEIVDELSNHAAMKAPPSPIEGPQCKQVLVNLAQTYQPSPHPTAFALVTRATYAIQTYWIDAAMAHLCGILQKGALLSAAKKSTLLQYPDFDVHEALTVLIDRGLLSVTSPTVTPLQKTTYFN